MRSMPATRRIHIASSPLCDGANLRRTHFNYVKHTLLADNPFNKKSHQLNLSIKLKVDRIPIFVDVTLEK